MAGTLFLVRSRTRSRFSGRCHGACAERAFLAALALAGCEDTPAAPGSGGGSNWEDTSLLPPPRRLEAASGLVPDEGFGTSLALDDDLLLVGAPFAGGRVYGVELHGDGTPTLLLEGAPTVGASVAGTRARFVAGAPIARQVLDESGSVVAEGEEGLGLAVAVDGDRWVAAHGTGWRSSDDGGEATTDRPSSLALDGATVVVGFAHGEKIAATTGTEPIARAPGVNEDGFSVAVLDGVVVRGDPAGARVFVDDLVLTPSSDTGGRFGHALAVADVSGDDVLDLVVGAPMDVDGGGSVTLYTGPDLEPATRWEGDVAGANLGTSVAAARGIVVAGAPGAPGDPGSVKIFSVE
jgi:hypothetical protein